MAKYTETLYEYLENGNLLPPSFSLIEGFEIYFIKRYAGLEIGFETEELFKNALSLRADLVLPIYAERITARNNALAKLGLGAKARYETRDYGKMESSNENEGVNYDLPYNAENSQPSAKSKMEGSATTAAHTDTIETKEDFTADELLRIIEMYNKNAHIEVQACLNEFKNLFMGIY